MKIMNETCNMVKTYFPTVPVVLTVFRHQGGIIRLDNGRIYESSRYYRSFFKASIGIEVRLHYYGSAGKTDFSDFFPRHSGTDQPSVKVSGVEVVKVLPREKLIYKSVSRGHLKSIEEKLKDIKPQRSVLTSIIQHCHVSQEDPLASSKARGTSYMKAEFDKPENLTLTDASKYSGRDDGVINLERKEGNLYALILEGDACGFRYPKWQFDIPAASLREVLNIFSSGSLHCWALHNFLIRPYSDLEGRSPSTALQDINFPLERVLEIVRRRIDLRQGAS